MSLLPRYTYPLYEVAARWSCTPADLAEWATMGQFKFVTGVPLVRCDDRAIAGMVALHAADMIPMFRRDGTTPPDDVREFEEAHELMRRALRDAA